MTAYADSAAIQRQRRTRARVIIDHRDVTYFRDIPAEVVRYELTEPYGYGPATIAFPQVSAALERHQFGRDGELSWVRKGAPVRIDRVDVETGAKVETAYHGVVLAPRIASDSLTLEIGGQLSGRLALREKQQTLVRKTADIGLLMWTTCRAVGVRLTPPFGPRIGLSIDDGTSGVRLLGWADHLLGMAQEANGDQWTVMPLDDGPRFEMRLKDRATIDATIWADAFGVAVDLVDDAAEQPNAIYGRGIAPDGGLWVNGKWPNLGPETVPPFPMSAGGVMSLGTTNEDTTTGEGVSVLKQELRSDGLLPLSELGGTYNDATVEAVESVQELAGLPVTGAVDAATWGAVWGSSVEQQNVGGATVHPLVVESAVQRWLFSPNGSRVGSNPDYDPGVLRVDRSVDFGAGVRKNMARRWARREMKRAGGDNYVGTITLTSDLWAGDHSHGAAGTVMEKESLRAGMNVRLVDAYDSIVLHVASITVTPGEVRLLVDSQARDALHVGELIQRDAEARRDPARNWLNTHRGSQTPKDSLVGWYSEDGAGLVRQVVNCPGGKWTVFPVIAGQEGTIMRTTVATSPPAEFCMAVAGREVAGEALDRRIGNPLAAGDNNPWTDEAVQDWLHDEKIVVYVAGDHEQPCGYWPKRHTDDEGETTSAPVTGKHRDYAPISYRTFGPPVLWVAIYPDRDTTIPAQEIFRAQRELGV